MREGGGNKGDGRPSRMVSRLVRYIARTRSREMEEGAGADSEHRARERLIAAIKSPRGENGD